MDFMFVQGFLPQPYLVIACSLGTHIVPMFVGYLDFEQPTLLTVLVFGMTDVYVNKC